MWTIHEPNLAAANHAVGVTQVRLTFAQRFYFGAKQHHARFQLLKKVVIVGSGAVLSHQQLSLFFLFFGRFGHS